jgi:hypothetical protein
MKTWYVGPHKVYALDETDKLWLGRALYGEGWGTAEERAAICWALMYRFMLRPGDKSTTSFTSLIRGFSQPVNPKWYEGGEICRNPSPKQASGCTAAKYERRRKIAAMSWEELPHEIRSDVEAFANGQLFPPEVISTSSSFPHISDWASYKGVEQACPNGLWIGKNWFCQNPNLYPFEVLVRQSDETPAPQKEPFKPPEPSGVATKVVVVAVVGVIAATIWAWWRVNH